MNPCTAEAWVDVFARDTPMSDTDIQRFAQPERRDGIMPLGVVQTQIEQAGQESGWYVLVWFNPDSTPDQFRVEPTLNEPVEIRMPARLCR